MKKIILICLFLVGLVESVAAERLRDEWSSSYLRIYNGMVVLSPFEDATDNFKIQFMKIEKEAGVARFAIILPSQRVVDVQGQAYRYLFDGFLVNKNGTLMLTFDGKERDRYLWTMAIEPEFLPTRLSSGGLTIIRDGWDVLWGMVGASEERSS